MFYKCGHITCLPCLREYRRLKYTFQTKLPCPTCLQLAAWMKLIHKVEKTKRPDSISMRMFKNAKFTCSYANCGKSYPLDKINHHKMYECLNRNIMCPARYFKYINNIETVINHSIKCPFHLIYCDVCKTLFNVAVLKHDCKVIQAQGSIPSDIKYFYEKPPPNHSHGYVVLGPHSFNKSFEDRYQIHYDTFMTVAHCTFTYISTLWTHSSTPEWS